LPLRYAGRVPAAIQRQMVLTETDLAGMDDDLTAFEKVIEGHNWPLRIAEPVDRIVAAACGRGPELGIAHHRGVTDPVERLSMLSTTPTEWSPRHAPRAKTRALICTWR
jgi:hypothetical protein